jgi:hypothetical protein
MTISNDDKIDLNKIVSEFIQYVNEDSPNNSTDPNVVRVKVIKADQNACPSCSRTARINSGG